MDTSADRNAIAFDGSSTIAIGALADVARAVKNVADQDEHASILIFDAETSHPIELDLRGSTQDVVDRLGPNREPERPSARRRGPGRPKLGVVGREITLLPRHWEWLERQPGSASVTLRKLVDQARQRSTPEDRKRLARESTYRFMAAIAGDQPGFEEATRALFSSDRDADEAFGRHLEAWPEDLRLHTNRLARDVFVDHGITS